MDKPALVADVSPLPKGYSGTIKVVNPKSIIAGDAAIFSYDCDETEVVFGQPLHARYHETDTWMNRNGRWQIVAGQVLRYYEDPAPGQTDPKRFGDYVGTYQLATEVLLTVTTDGTNLYSQRSNRPKVTVIPEEGDIFFVKGVEGRRLFRRNASGRVDALIDRRNNEDILWKKVK